MVTTVAKRVGVHELRSRASDKYVDATTLCKASGKVWHDYFRREETDEFLKALEDITGQDRKILVQSTRGRTGGARRIELEPRTGGDSWHVATISLTALVRTR